MRAQLFDIGTFAQAPKIRMLFAIANFLMVAQPRQLGRLRRGLFEFLYFGIKEARACLCVAAFFASVLLMPRAGIAGIPRYDLLLNNSYSA